MIRKDKIPTSWPYHPVDLDKESFVVPDYLQHFVLSLLTGNPENEKSSNRLVMLMQSFSQDFIYIYSKLWSTKASETPVVPVCS